MLFFWLGLQSIVGLAAVGGLVYFLLALWSAAIFPRHRISPKRLSKKHLPPISLLKPLCGAETELETCLSSFFQLKYPRFELIFAVRTHDDPAVAVVRRLRARFPGVRAQLLFTGEPPYANAKVFSLEKMAEAAAYDLLVITDSDTKVSADYLGGVAAAFADRNVGGITHPYRGVASGDLWSRLEALGMTTEFMAGVIVAERLEGMKFALGPSMAIRRDCLKAIGGFAAMKDYLADDFVLGAWAAQAGWKVLLLPQAVEHVATARGFLTNFKHRLRWNRSSRFSRPAGYVGQGFTYGLVWAMGFAALTPWPLNLAVFSTGLLLRIGLALTLARRLGDRAVKHHLWLIPLQDLISWMSWIGGFLGKTIEWRGERYVLLDGGRFQPLTRQVKVEGEARAVK
ncbi:MAG: bacteriohopanetetrol glucosamine biosynthesis glycosyltransferase HpnI [Chloracidobacterium sp.]|uniref:Bacteriohopanetetrol glucosamine biosynthesis glycosyltransferase HpnI n=1 Tax=Chloracidobacterium validum TaxID=2821543 RepID=A0ABX8BEI2_9BACT|nr:bacteriohopanetetrol glucosamine biosynthesis glycosyltransferase HpnI [Chloracidobacterium validum]QUW04300.1 bacteriohopanetetrol glucosamine biosynthesis glycosyltransferase HpnI [Chloracidobacterium validum]